MEIIRTKKIAFKTLGCRLNQYETDALVSDFHQAGYNLVDFSEKADVYVINTCTVTNQSDQKSRNIINQAKAKNEDGLVVVTGCMAEDYKQRLEQSNTQTYVVNNKNKASILPLVQAHYSGEIMAPESLPENVFTYQVVDKSLHTRTSIKIQDGCDNFCTFCIIPSVRGKAVSRPLEEIIQNVKAVLANGFKEIVITGVNIGRYQYGEYRFEDVLEAILNVEGDFRVRISSLEPDGLSSRFYELFTHPKMCPHLHLCLQSGSDRILMQMRRMYTTQQFRESVEKIRSIRPDFNFTTDLIVGFPDETEEDFRKSISFCEEMNFSHIHTFRYSKRKDTRAERMKNQVPEPVKANRSKEVHNFIQQQHLTYLKSFVGKKQRVLIEKLDEEGFAHGYGEHYVPVKFPARSFKKNQLVDVHIDRIELGESPVLIGKE